MGDFEFQCQSSDQLNFVLALPEFYHDTITKNRKKSCITYSKVICTYCTYGIYGFLGEKKFELLLSRCEGYNISAIIARLIQFCHDFYYLYPIKISVSFKLLCVLHGPKLQVDFCSTKKNTTYLYFCICILFLLLIQSRRYGKKTIQAKKLCSHII